MTPQEQSLKLIKKILVWVSYNRKSMAGFSTQLHKHAGMKKLGALAAFRLTLSQTCTDASHTIVCMFLNKLNWKEALGLFFSFLRACVVLSWKAAMDSELYWKLYKPFTSYTVQYWIQYHIECACLATALETISGSSDRPDCCQACISGGSESKAWHSASRASGAEKQL